MPLGALADAYLDALATLDDDRLGTRQRVRRGGQPADPDQVPGDAAAAFRRGAGGAGRRGARPEAELRARLILYRAFRDAGTRLLDGAAAALGLFHREPTAAHAAGVAGARPPTAAPLDPRSSSSRSIGLARIAPPPAPPPETIRRTVTLTARAAIIREALRGAPAVVLQDLLAGVRDRVVVAVTFLALLELMKRREIVVEQAEPWGPIVARPTTAAERAASGAGVAGRRGRPARRVAGVVRVTELETAEARRGGGARRGAGLADRVAGAPRRRRASSPRPSSRRSCSSRRSRCRAGRSRLLAGVDRATVDARLGDLEVALAGRGIRLVLSGDRVELTTAPEAGALIARYVGADAVRLSPAALETLAIVAYRQPVTRARSSASAASTPTTRSGRCSIGG